MDNLARHTANFVVQLGLDHEVWLNQNKSMLDKLHDIERAIKESSDEEYVSMPIKALANMITHIGFNRSFFWHDAGKCYFSIYLKDHI